MAERVTLQDLQEKAKTNTDIRKMLAYWQKKKYNEEQIEECIKLLEESNFDRYFIKIVSGFNPIE